jgi:hypothetical protein
MQKMPGAKTRSVQTPKQDPACSVEGREERCVWLVAGTSGDLSEMGIHSPTPNPLHLEPEASDLSLNKSSTWFWY